MTEVLKNQGPLAPTLGEGSIITKAEFEQRGQQPYDSNPMGGVANLDSLSMDRYGNSYAGHGYMHVTDHIAAWEVVHPGVVPTWFDIEDSHNVGGDKLISEASRIVAQTHPPDNLMSCLTVALGVANGSRIFDRIMAGERTLVKGRYAGLDYDCSAFSIPGGGTPPPIIPPPPEPPPPPPPPPAPVVTKDMIPYISDFDIATASQASSWVPFFRGFQKRRLDILAKRLVEVNRALSKLETLVT